MTISRSTGTLRSETDRRGKSRPSSFVSRQEIAEVDGLFDDWLERESTSPPLRERQTLKKKEEKMRRLAKEMMTNLRPLIPFGSATYNPTDNEGSDRQRQSSQELTAVNAAWRQTAECLLDRADDLDARLKRWDSTKGGKLTIESMRFGQPKDRLAAWCFDLFEKYRPGSAAATENGEFHLFCEARRKDGACRAKRRAQQLTKPGGKEAKHQAMKLKALSGGDMLNAVRKICRAKKRRKPAK